MQKLKAEVRQRICAAALAEFKQYGYAAANIRRIAEKAEISLGNIYRYFLNKEALYLAIIEPFKSNIKGFFGLLMNDSKEQSCRDFAVALTEFVYGHKDEFVVVVFNDCPQCKPSIADFLTELTVPAIKSRADGKMKQLGNKPQNPSFYDLVARGYINAVIEVFKQKNTKEKRIDDLAELTEFYFSLPGRD